jgi:hypothetical protein
MFLIIYTSRNDIIDFSVIGQKRIYCVIIRHLVFCILGMIDRIGCSWSRPITLMGYINESWLLNAM